MEEETESSKNRSEKLKDMKLENQRWKNRRWMAWISVLSFNFYTYYMFFEIPTDRIKVLDQIYSWTAIFCMSVVGAYMGFTTYYEAKKKSSDNNGM
jgi:magnesium-transporting ATPase (P-type)